MDKESSGLLPSCASKAQSETSPLGPSEVFGELSSSLGTQLQEAVLGVPNAFVVSWLLIQSPGKDSCVCTGIKMEGSSCSPF